VEERLGQGVRSAPQAEPAGAAVPRLGPNPLSPAETPLLERWFGRDDITAVRHEVSDRLAAAGLAGDRLQGFVLAVNEVITNVVLHTGGSGRIVLWLAEGSAWCTVTDSGSGIPAKYLSVPAVPGTYEVGGRGIWLAHQLCDEVTVATGPLGTAVGLRIGLPRRSIGD